MRWNLVWRGRGGLQDDPGQTTLLRWTPSPQLVEHWVDLLSIGLLLICLIQFSAFLFNIDRWEKLGDTRRCTRQQHHALGLFHQKSGGKPKCTKSLGGNQNAPKVCHTVFMLALKFTDIFWSRFVGRWWKGPGPTGPPARSWICRVRGSSSLQTPAESSEVDTCHKIW